MIYLMMNLNKSMLMFALDLNVEAQTWCFLRTDIQSPIYQDKFIFLQIANRS
jgi:hypothetical protein